MAHKIYQTREELANELRTLCMTRTNEYLTAISIVDEVRNVVSKFDGKVVNARIVNAISERLKTKFDAFKYIDKHVKAIWIRLDEHKAKHVNCLILEGGCFVTGNRFDCQEFTRIADEVVERYRKELNKINVEYSKCDEFAAKYFQVIELVNELSDDKVFSFSMQNAARAFMDTSISYWDALMKRY